MWDRIIAWRYASTYPAIALSIFSDPFLKNQIFQSCKTFQSMPLLNFSIKMANKKIEKNLMTTQTIRCFKYVIQSAIIVSMFMFNLRYLLVFHPIWVYQLCDFIRYFFIVDYHSFNLLCATIFHFSLNKYLI